MLPKSFMWDWPLSDDGVAKCLATKEKFTVSLEFTSGGEVYDQTTVKVSLKPISLKTILLVFEAKKIEQFKESMSSWSLGLSSMNTNGLSTASFWRLDIDVLPNLNMLAIEAFRDISHSDRGGGKVLRRIRKVYRLPIEFDITTLTTSSSIYGVIVLEALRRTNPTSIANQRFVKC